MRKEALERDTREMVGGSGKEVGLFIIPLSRLIAYYSVEGFRGHVK
jgi:hypothetical protein